MNHGSQRQTLLLVAVAVAGPLLGSGGCRSAERKATSAPKKRSSVPAKSATSASAKAAKVAPGKVAPATLAKVAKPTKVARTGPVVVVHALKVTGSLDATEGREVVDFNLPGWRRCYLQALAKAPGLCGWLRVQTSARRHGGFSSRPGAFKIGTPTGSIENRPLLDCLSFRLRAPRAELAAPATGFEITLVFAPTPAQQATCAPPVGAKP